MTDSGCPLSVRTNFGFWVVRLGTDLSTPRVSFPKTKSATSGGIPPFANVEFKGLRLRIKDLEFMIKDVGVGV